MYQNGTTSLIKAYPAGWRKTRHAIVLVDFGGPARSLISYDGPEGAVAIYDVGPQGKMEQRRLFTGEWHPSWTQIVPGRPGAAP